MMETVTTNRMEMMREHVSSGEVSREEGRAGAFGYPIGNPPRITTKKVRRRRVKVIKRRKRTYLRGRRGIRI